MAIQVAEYKTKRLDHLELIAGMYDELGIGETIDQVIPQDLEKNLIPWLDYECYGNEWIRLRQSNAVPIP